MYFVNVKFMWKIAIIGFIIMIVGLCPILAGCDAPYPPDKNIQDNNAWMPQGRGVKTKVVEIDGHTYIIMDGCHSGGIIHAESCNCKKQ